MSYNTDRVKKGSITELHLRTLVRHWQATHPPLIADGECGPLTTASLVTDSLPIPLEKCGWPAPMLEDGRLPVITSGHAEDNQYRANHFGVDIMYEKSAAEAALPIGDAASAPRHFVPEGTPALAFADGTITIAGNIGTGYRLWIAHGLGLHSGYFHLDAARIDTSRIKVGVAVKRGDILGFIHHAPNGDDPIHLHFDLYFGDIGKYPEGTLNPRHYLNSVAHGKLS